MEIRSAVNTREVFSGLYLKACGLMPPAPLKLCRVFGKPLAYGVLNLLAKPVPGAVNRQLEATGDVFAVAQ